MATGRIAQILTSVPQTLTIATPTAPVPIMMAPSVAVVTRATKAMVHTAKTSMSVQLVPMNAILMPPAKTMMVPLLALVILDTVEMVPAVLTSMSVQQTPTIVLPMQLAQIAKDPSCVFATQDTQATALSA